MSLKAAARASAAVGTDYAPVGLTWVLEQRRNQQTTDAAGKVNQDRLATPHHGDSTTRPPRRHPSPTSARRRTAAVRAGWRDHRALRRARSRDRHRSLGAQRRNLPRVRWPGRPRHPEPRRPRHPVRRLPRARRPGPPPTRVAPGARNRARGPRPPRGPGRRRGPRRPDGRAPHAGDTRELAGQEKPGRPLHDDRLPDRRSRLEPSPPGRSGGVAAP